MAYAAIINVGKWTPGEIIGEKLSDEQAARLLEKGAIRMVMDAPEPAFDGEGSIPKAAAEAPAEEPQEAAPEEEIEAPVIDVSDTLAKPAPKKRGGRRK